MFNKELLHLIEKSTCPNLACIYFNDNEASSGWVVISVGEAPKGAFVKFNLPLSLYTNKYIYVNISSIEHIYGS